MSVANTSHHLQVLKEAGLVAATRDGTRVRYRLASPAVYRFWVALRSLAAERLPGVQGLVEAYPGASRSRTEMLACPCIPWRALQCPRALNFPALVSSGVLLCPGEFIRSSQHRPNRTLSRVVDRGLQPGVSSRASPAVGGSAERRQSRDGRGCAG